MVSRAYVFRQAKQFVSYVVVMYVMHIIRVQIKRLPNVWLYLVQIVIASLFHQHSTKLIDWIYLLPSRPTNYDIKLVQRLCHLHLFPTPFSLSSHIYTLRPSDFWSRLSKNGSIIWWPNMPLDRRQSTLKNSGKSQEGWTLESTYGNLYNSKNLSKV